MKLHALAALAAGLSLTVSSAATARADRMSASGEGIQKLTDTPIGQASQSAVVVSRQELDLVSPQRDGQDREHRRIGALGENPVLWHDPPGGQLYPSLSADMTQILFVATASPTGDTDRAIQIMNVDGSDLRTLADVPGAFDSAPAWSPDRTQIAFESNADVASANPERDGEIWLMSADGANRRQITHDAIHDEGPAWSPDATMLAYPSGVDDRHLDITLMTTRGVRLRTLTDYGGRAESPDWQAFPAPDTDRRCGDLATSGPGARDVRVSGVSLSCDKALELAAQWSASATPGARTQKITGFDYEAEDFGGLWRVVLTHRGNRVDKNGNDKVVAFLFQP